MGELLKQTIAQLRTGAQVIWCVILSAKGSTPQSPGAKMAVFSDGSSVGTVGGGAMELQAFQTACAPPRDAKAFVREYELFSGGSSETGMICGGRVQIGFLPLSADKPDLMQLLLQLQDALDHPEDLWLETVIRPDGSFSLRLLAVTDLHTELPRLSRTPVLAEVDGMICLTEPVCRNEMVYLFGGGHVSRALVPILIGLSFPVTVYDPRPEFLQGGRFPGAKVVLGEFDGISNYIRLTVRDYAVVMTPAHTMDLCVLRQLLHTEASYIGCMGSKRKTAFINQALRGEGFSETDIARIHAPIGLPIRAKTPEEIAVSIAAEMILHRAGGPSYEETGSKP